MQSEKYKNLIEESLLDEAFFVSSYSSSSTLFLCY